MRWNVLERTECHRHDAPRVPPGVRAFTLVELIVALAILSILMGIAAPSFLDSLSDRRLVSVRDDLAWDLRRARIHSLVRQRPVIVCPTLDGATCAPAWVDDWLVFADEPGGDAVALDAGDTLLEVRRSSGRAEAVGIAVRVRSRWSGTSVPATRFVFPGSARGASGFVIVCGGRGLEQARTLRISVAGEIDSSASRDADGALLDSWGASASCP